LTGFLSQHQEGGLAAGMVALTADPARRRQMGETARKSSERFDIRATVGQTLDLYEELRRTRPDLKRQNEHGRWPRTWAKLEPLVEQLVNLTRPPKPETDK
jgi:hypothetical protein